MTVTIRQSITTSKEQGSVILKKERANLKAILWQSIQEVLLYGSESWVLKFVMENILESFHHNLLITLQDNKYQ
jgi:hypothetical protein